MNEQVTTSILQRVYHFCTVSMHHGRFFLEDVHQLKPVVCNVMNLPRVIVKACHDCTLLFLVRES